MKKVLVLIIFLLFCGTLFGNYIWDHDKFSSGNTWDIGEPTVRGRNLYFVLVDANTITDGVLSINSGSIADAVDVTASGIVQAGQITSTGNILIANDGYIGSVSEPNAIQIDANGNVRTIDNFAAAGTVQSGGVFSAINTSGTDAILVLASTFDGGGGGSLRYESDNDLFILSQKLLVGGNITIGDGSDMVVSLFLSGGHGLFGIEWEEGDEVGDNDFLVFRAENTNKWDIHLGTTDENMNIIVDGSNCTLTLQDFDVIIEENTELQGTVTLSGLTGPSGIYINVLEEITTVVPDGIVGHLKRTGTLLETANAGDNLELGGDLDVGGESTFNDHIGILTAPSASTVLKIAGDIESADGFSTIGLGTTITPTGADKSFNSIEFIGIYGDSAFDVDTIRGGYGLIQINGTYTGTISNVRVFSAEGVVNKGFEEGPTITNWSSFYSINPSTEGFGVNEITNVYGLYIEDLTAGTTLNVAIKTGLGLVLLGDETHIGNGTNETVIGATGDLSFAGGGGFIEGHMTIPGVDVVVDTSATADPVEVADDGTGVPDAGDGWASVYQNEITFAVSDLHYQTVTIAGTYKVIWDQSPKTAAGGGTVIHGGIMIDGVAVRDNGEGHAHVFNANDNIQINGIGVIDCPNGNEEISLWISNNANQKTAIEHGNMNIQLIGGT